MVSQKVTTSAKKSNRPKKKSQYQRKKANLRARRAARRDRRRRKRSSIRASSSSSSSPSPVSGRHRRRPAVQVLSPPSSSSSSSGSSSSASSSSSEEECCASCGHYPSGQVTECRRCQREQLCGSCSLSCAICHCRIPYCSKCVKKIMKEEEPWKRVCACQCGDGSCSSEEAASDQTAVFCPACGSDHKNVRYCSYRRCGRLIWKKHSVLYKRGWYCSDGCLDDARWERARHSTQEERWSLMGLEEEETITWEQRKRLGFLQEVYSGMYPISAVSDAQLRDPTFSGDG